MKVEGKTFLTAAAAAAIVVVLAGCTSAGEPENASATATPSAATPTPEATTESPETATPTPTTFPTPADTAEPDIPNIALRRDGKTPIPCADWPSLSNERQHELVFSALVQSLVVPVTDEKVNKARRIVGTDCRSEPRTAAYVVAMRVARNV